MDDHDEISPKLVSLESRNTSVDVTTRAVIEAGSASRHDALEVYIYGLPGSSVYRLSMEVYRGGFRTLLVRLPLWKLVARVVPRTIATTQCARDSLERLNRCEVSSWLGTVACRKCHSPFDHRPVPFVFQLCTRPEVVA